MDKDHITILLIDDDEDDYVLVKELLSEVNLPVFSLEWVKTYREGWSELCSADHDVYLLDYRLGSRDGLELIREAMKAGCDEPIIFLTGQGDREVDMGAMKAGAADYLVKAQLTTDMLERSIRFSITRKESERELRRYRDRLEDLVRERTEQLETANEKLRLEMAEREQAEQKAVQLAAIVQYSDDAIIGKNIDGIITSWNKGAEKIYGYAESEVIGKPFSLLIPPGREDEVSRILGAIKSGEHIGHYETERRRKDGRVLWMSLVVSPVRDAKGRIVAASSIERDITGRRAVEDECKRCMTAIEQAGEAIVITDSQGTIEFVNPAFERITGYTREEAVGKNPRLLKSGMHDELFYSNIWDTISGGTTWAGRLVNKRKDGTFYTEEATISPVRDSFDQIVHYVAVKRDITDQLQLVAQFQQAQKMEAVGLLAGGVAHDYNNMLGVIIGYAELALQKLDPVQPLHADLEQIHKAAQRSAGITRQLLAFARKQTIVPVLLDLNLNVASMLRMLKRLIGEQIELAWLPGTGLWPVKMDPTQVDQILANLCVNAKDAIVDVGKITIETRNAVLDKTYCAHHPGAVVGEYVLLAVSDDGCGMDREILDHIFEPFFTSKGMGQGTGLGLSTVYGIVKQNGGFISVYSQPGKGTAFKIYLPRDVDQPPIHNQGKMATVSSPGHGETVLLAEDELELMTMVQMMLEKLGYRVLAANTPGEALRLADEHAGEIRLLLTDVVMPEMNGPDLAQRLQSLYPDMKTMFMSGYTADVIAGRGVLNAGVNFIQKPFSMNELSVKVREALREK